MQEVGREWGVTTKRKRRCGWLDLVQLQYSHSLNDFTSLMITKLDILDGFKEIKVAVGYSIDGVKLASNPASIETYDKIEVEYKTFAGWETPIVDVREFDDLPANAKVYLKFIEDFLNVKIQWVGVGPARDATLQVF